jgi:serine phosphatase RsbU (regulator of sigma subunit)
MNDDSGACVPQADGNFDPEQRIAALTAELRESVEQQAATAEVLRMISHSSRDAQPVFDMIARCAKQLCDGQFCAVFRFDGALIHLVAHHGISAEGAVAYERGFPVPPSRVNAISRAVEGRCIAHIPDVEADQGYGSLAVSRAVTFRSIVAVPMMRGDEPVGGIAVSRSVVGLFPAAHIEQLQTFADQAVIAIENARLFQELEARTEALTRSGEQLASVHSQVTALNTQLQSENLRMGSELEVTRRLQLMLLPGAAELQGVDGLDIAGHMQPAVEVGGDYFDVLQHDGRVKIGIGDVTGHGLESGVLMVMTQAIVRALLTNGETDHVRFLSTLNQALFGNVQRMGGDKNLTLCLLDYAAGVVKLSGQHEEMIVVRNGGAVERVDTVDLGFPVGLVDDISAFVGQATVRLAPGDGIVLYTDGITEAENMANEQYGLARLCEVISRHWSEPAESIKEAVVSDVATYIGSQTVYDDITLVVLKQKEGGRT